VVPAPDGGYPGGNTAEGQNALFSLTIGTYNTAVGLLSLRALTFGEFNTGVGAGTLFFNNAHRNTAIGAGALLSNVTGHGNTANGTFALLNNTSGDDNIALGNNAGSLLTTGDFNIDIGNPGLAGESQHKVEEQQTTITELKFKVAQQQQDFQAIATHQQKQIDALTAGLQKVNDQLQLSQPAPQMALSNQ